MNLYQRFYRHVILRPTSWKNAARLNCMSLVCLVFLLLGITIFSITKSHDLMMVAIIHEGPCDQVSKVNKGLHLILNVVSSLILASSNFFMQILNAPARSEINKAHNKGTWLEIGVPSIRNTFRVSWFKTTFWVVLLLSSIPIHMVFNSAIFQVDRALGDFHVTIASEAFVKGEPYLLPGVSLSPAWDQSSTWDFWPKIVNKTGEPNFKQVAAMLKQSSAAVNISYTQNHANAWDRLSVEECYNQYASHRCKGLRTHRNLAIILKEPQGYTRSNTWNLTRDQAAFWDMIIPSDQPNPLWYFSACYMSTEKSSWNECESSCFLTQPTGASLQTWIIDKFTNARPVHDESKTYGVTGSQVDTPMLQISHCLAEPLEQTCRIGMSSILLFAVLVCVVLKVAAAVTVTWKLSRQPGETMVTVGDALKSFISKPDATTLGICTSNQKNVHKAMKESPATTPSTPQKWCNTPKNLGSFIPISVWTTSYALIGIGLLFTLLLLGRSASIDNGIHDVFGPSLNNTTLTGDTPFLWAVFLANCMQGLEMAHHSTGYWPLRVTEPEYSLPLIAVSSILHWLLSITLYVLATEGNYIQPYDDYDKAFQIQTSVTLGYSLTAALVMAIVSLVVSVCPIIFALRKLPSGMNNVGNNSLAISAACHASTTSAAVKQERPSCVSKVSAHLKAISSPSLELVFASRGSEPAVSRHASYENGPAISRDDSNQPFLSSKHSSDMEKALSSEEQTLLNISRSRIRWGVIRMPPEWYRNYETSIVPVEHLGFGVEEDGVESPVNGKYYA